MEFRKLMMSVGVVALLTGVAVAQETTGQADSNGTTTIDPGAAAPAPEFTSLEEMTVADVIGLTVVSTEGDTIGEIDYVIEDANGASAVIGIGGFLGLGEYTVALPLSDFGYDVTQGVLTLGTDKETLKELPEFDETDAESLPDETPVAGLVEEGASDSEDTSIDNSDTGGASVDPDSSANDVLEDSGSGDAETSDDSVSEQGSGTSDGTTGANPTEGASGDDGMSEEGASESGSADDSGSEEETEQIPDSEG